MKKSINCHMVDQMSNESQLARIKRAIKIDYFVCVLALLVFIFGAGMVDLLDTTYPYRHADSIAEEV